MSARALAYCLAVVVLAVLVIWTTALYRDGLRGRLFETGLLYVEGLLGLIAVTLLFVRAALAGRERARATQRLKQAMQEHLDTLTTLTATVGTDGELLLVNRTAAQESGLDPNVLRSTNFLDGPWFSFDEAVSARVREHFRKAVQGQSVSFEENLNLTRGVTPLLMTFTPHIEAGGRVSYVLAEGRDLRQQRYLEEELRRSQEQLAEAQRISHLGSFEWDIREDRVSWSEELYRIFGVAPEEFGQYVSDCLSRSR